MRLIPGLWRWSIRLGLVLLVLAPVCADAAQPKRVLLLHSFGPRFAPFDAFSGDFREELARQMPGPLDIYEASLETARFRDGPQDAPFVNYLLALFGGERRPDLVVAVGGPAVLFAERYRPQLFPSTPLLVTGLDERRLQGVPLTPNDAVVAIRQDLPSAVENILRLLPKTSTIMVVLGNSPLEKFWLAEGKREFEPFTKRVNFIWTNDLPFDQILKRAALLPPNSAILYGLMVVDAQGVPHEENQTMADLHAVADAPMFGLYDSQLGEGIVGGALVSVAAVARNAASAAVRILDGEPPSSISTPAEGPGTPTYDQRELTRWGIRDARLPASSAIVFREPTGWERYKWQITAVAILCLVEAGFILALLASRRRLNEAKEKLRASEERMSLAATAANLGLWVWDIARDEMWVAESGRAVFGLSKSEPLNFEQFVKAVHPDDREMIGRAIELALAGKEDLEIEYRLSATDGAPRWIATRGRVEFDAAGKATLMRGVSIDITERRRAEEAAHDLSGRLITAQEEERARLARELHDDVTQRLALLAIEAGRGERKISSAAGGETLHNIHEGLVRLSEDVHALSYRLHPSILEDLGLVEALKTECERFSRVESVPVDIKSREVPEVLPHPVALCLFRVTQEALRNVGRHACASKVEVLIRPFDGGLQLSVKDDGDGFDPVRLRSRPSLGHASMRQRIFLLGGELHIESIPNEGTTVLAWVPLKEEHGEPPARAPG